MTVKQRGQLNNHRERLNYVKQPHAGKSHCIKKPTETHPIIGQGIQNILGKGKIKYNTIVFLLSPYEDT